MSRVVDCASDRAWKMYAWSNPLGKMFPHLRPVPRSPLPAPPHPVLVAAALAGGPRWEDYHRPPFVEEESSEGLPPGHFRLPTFRPPDFRDKTARRKVVVTGPPGAGVERVTELLRARVPVPLHSFWERSPLDAWRDGLETVFSPESADNPLRLEALRELTEFFSREPVWVFYLWRDASAGFARTADPEDGDLEILAREHELLCAEYDEYYLGGTEVQQLFETAVVLVDRRTPSDIADDIWGRVAGRAIEWYGL